eukprot:CAMPEP_0119061458 /NCGR_PEP_ID=MMETSP1178-20130426/5246_1 /TAXON_ID=33656 /ORGANISM="unid sp, Strain CCMP2000" /LENGTH=31 /DNA_ID= /DNA_START= /DNA_END= /DNA_ORIENTATION=
MAHAQAASSHARRDVPSASASKHARASTRFP